ncbi:MAG TPA: PLDc N-terminal domain-containing protein [Cellulomonas sp.]
MSFWESFWLVIEIFLFVAYLVVLFHVVTDLFRDRALSGWGKAVWVLCLVLVPWLTALVYLIARGTGMAERQQAAVAHAQQGAEQYIRTVAGHSPAQEIATAQQLLSSGAIDAQEFAALKARALAQA